MAPTEAAELLVPRIERALGYIADGVRLARRAQRLPALPAVERRVTLGQLRALVAVDDAGSFTLAAARAGISQPAIYRAVHELGTAIETPLTERHGKTVQTTPAATRMLRWCGWRCLNWQPAWTKWPCCAPNRAAGSRSA